VVAAVLGLIGPLSAPEREYLRERAILAGFGSEPENLEDDAQTLADDLRTMRKVGLSRTVSADDVEVPLDAADDQRWGLLQDLDAKRTDWAIGTADLADFTPEQGDIVADDLVERRAGAPRWVPLRVRTSRPIGFYTGNAPPAVGRMVEIHFDARIPLVRLTRGLRNTWPELLKRGMVERSRPLGARKIKLLRFVCLDMPSVSWGERHDEWNRRFPDWAYAKRQVFITECHDAEESLAGRPHALAWFYNAKTRLATEDLEALKRQGDRDAARELDRRMAGGLDTLNRARIKVVREPPAPPTALSTPARTRATRKHTAKGGQHGKTRKR